MVLQEETAIRAIPEEEVQEDPKDRQDLEVDVKL